MIKYGLNNESLGTLNVTHEFNQYTFGYPCSLSEYECTSYYVDLSPGVFQFEAWGSVGTKWKDAKNPNTPPSIPGQGSYTSGIINISKNLRLYLFIGANTLFNNVKENLVGSVLGGASSDVRLKLGNSWHDIASLRSRIMVAGGGGGAEWPLSKGGNGGLVGSNGETHCNFDETICNDIYSYGGNQKSGGRASTNNKFLWEERVFSGINGDFGFVPVGNLDEDYGGLGGNGYWSGASQRYAGSGGGGSSFVSGHPGCITLQSEGSNVPSETNSPIHPSNYKFYSTSIISGNSQMPLYFSRTSSGIGNQNIGGIRITILSFCGIFSCINNIYNYRFIISSLFLASAFSVE
ncbi:hypothetical protein TVAG_257130 [Trichomonas vaginalis G3]|uniref:receptor protein-tyrosine kinase n=1 Tax=Trichomonas vaginalis (strain ATCC PRA-98 / G3) TaxID=412133 RepID=A2G0P5_TRIV3|nr:glycine-rich protein family [Trichomonas vaginalis G3]EAX89270.1 hypothetical protein TVAG_257130 [Trichomonas vaginalis G3]KAI5501952.1 glycine-rich protein family [Trichomonas vaginalis G3]|eukprot:XP_001302200.1 hypothetical protein [Trichomonas vaginalis G3]